MNFRGFDFFFSLRLNKTDRNASPQIIYPQYTSVEKRNIDNIYPFFFNNKQNFLEEKEKYKSGTRRNNNKTAHKSLNNKELKESINSEKNLIPIRRR